MYSIRDEIAVLAKSGRGIGREIEINLAKTEAKIVLNVKKRIDDGIATLGDVKKYSCGIMVQADPFTREGRREHFNETMQEFGKCGMLINNAWISIVAPFLESNNRLIKKTMTMNLYSTIYCFQELNRNMDDCLIINISSIEGTRLMIFISIYGMTKADIIKLEKYLALELFKNIMVNAIALSVVRTVMGNSILNILIMNKKRYADKYTLMKNTILLEDVVKAILFLIRLKISWIKQ